MMNKSMKIVIELVLVIGFIIFIKTICLADMWEASFVSLPGIDGGTKGSITNVSKSGFKVELNPVGHGGVWGCLVESKYTIPADERYTYKVSFTAESTNVDKYIYYVIGSSDPFSGGNADWIKLPKGKSVYAEYMYFGSENTNMYFGLGGDPGDRDNPDITWDYDAAIRYSIFDAKFKDINHKELMYLDCGGDFNSSTDIIVSNLRIEKADPIIPSFEPTQNSSSYKKKTLKKRLKIKYAKSQSKRCLTLKWKRVKKISGYEFYISKKKNFKSHTIRRRFNKKLKKVIVVWLKSKKVYYIKGRVFKKTKGPRIYGKWSKVKRVRIK